MKKIMVFLTAAVFAIAVVAYAAEDAKTEQPSTRKLMQARQAWLAAIGKNLEAKQFEAVGKDANALAAQTQMAGENHPNPVGKEITLSISTLAKDISTAAAAQDGDTAKRKLGEIKTKCALCHTTFRH